MASVRCPRCAARTRILVSLHPPVSFLSPRPPPSSTTSAAEAGTACILCHRCSASLYVYTHPGPTIPVLVPAPVDPIPASAPLQFMTFDAEEECEDLLQYTDDDNDDDNNNNSHNHNHIDEEDRAPLQSGRHPPHRPHAGRPSQPPPEDRPYEGSSDDERALQGHDHSSTQRQGHTPQPPQSPRSPPTKDENTDEDEHAITGKLKDFGSKAKRKAKNFTNPDDNPFSTDVDDRTESAMKWLEQFAEQDWSVGNWEPTEDAYEIYTHVRLNSGDDADSKRHAFFRSLAGMGKTIAEGIGMFDAADPLKGVSIGIGKALDGLNKIRTEKTQLDELFLRLLTLVNLLVEACSASPLDPLLKECAASTLRFFKLLCRILEDVHRDSFRRQVRDVTDHLRDRNENRLRILDLMFQDLRFRVMISLLIQRISDREQPTRQPPPSASKGEESKRNDDQHPPSNIPVGDGDHQGDGPFPRAEEAGEEGARDGDGDRQRDRPFPRVEEAGEEANLHPDAESTGVQTAADSRNTWPRRSRNNKDGEGSRKRKRSLFRVFKGKKH